VTIYNFTSNYIRFNVNASTSVAFSIDNLSSGKQYTVYRRGLAAWKIESNSSGGFGFSSDVSGEYSFDIETARADRAACTSSLECANYCVHDVCRSEATYCGDGYCDGGETYSGCPKDCNEEGYSTSGGGGGGSGSGLATTTVNTTTTTTATTTTIPVTVIETTIAGATTVETTAEATTTIPVEPVAEERDFVYSLIIAGVLIMILGVSDIIARIYHIVKEREMTWDFSKFAIREKMLKWRAILLAFGLVLVAIGIVLWLMA